MPRQEVSIVEQRREFVRLAMLEGANRRELCRRFGIHPDTGYKWLRRWTAGEEALVDRSRRPQASPNRCSAAIEALVLGVRDAHPAWGARRIARCLERAGVTRYSAVGQPFDPTRHEAITRMVSASAEPGTVVAETAPGYALHGRVLRPALVAVAAAPDEDAA